MEVKTFCEREQQSKVWVSKSIDDKTWLTDEFFDALTNAVRKFTTQKKYESMLTSTLSEGTAINVAQDIDEDFIKSLLTVLSNHLCTLSEINIAPWQLCKKNKLHMELLFDVRGNSIFFNPQETQEPQDKGDDNEKCNKENN